MPWISAQDLCRTPDCSRCEIHDADGKDGLCETCRAMVKRGSSMELALPFGHGASGYAEDRHLISDPHQGELYRSLRKIEENEFQRVEGRTGRGRIHADRVKRRIKYHDKGA